ncbi:hypothetical protein ACFHYQ_08435 [Sphaerimonospora cavernae]|uniref:PIN domain-containing protein n=1 Tax=Sphaerimonospora cavernae TaxID=1740611 RepID=A0ABV6U1I7_9ACTN
MPADNAFVLDAAFLKEAARGDIDIINMIQQFDAERVALVIPALAATAAAIDVGGTPERVAVLRGICRLDSARFAGLVDFDDTTELARMRLAVEALPDLWDVQAAEQAIMRSCPVLTVNYGLWKSAVHEASGELTVVEVAELD